MVNDDGVRRLAAQSLERAAGAMGMMQVAVGDQAHLAGLGIDHHEHGGRAEMAVNRAFQTFIALYRETEFHGHLLRSFCA